MTKHYQGAVGPTSTVVSGRRVGVAEEEDCTVPMSGGDVRGRPSTSSVTSEVNAVEPVFSAGLPGPGCRTPCTRCSWGSTTRKPGPVTPGVPPQRMLAAYVD